MTDTKDSPAAAAAVPTPDMAATGAPSESASATPGEAQAPAKTRRPSRRRVPRAAETASDVASDLAPDVASDSAETPDPPARPSRSRRASKKTGAAAETPTSDAGSDVPGEASAHPARPRRTRRDRKRDDPTTESQATEVPSVAEQVLDVEARAPDAAAAPESGKGGRRRSRPRGAAPREGAHPPAESGPDTPLAPFATVAEDTVTQPAPHQSEALDETAVSPHDSADAPPASEFSGGEDGSDSAVTASQDVVQDAASDGGADENAGEAARRKSRRGRRGGRGRNRRKRPADPAAPDGVARDGNGDAGDPGDDMGVVESLDPESRPLLPGGTAFPAESPEEADAEDDGGDVGETPGDREGGGKKGGVRAAAVKARAAAGRKRMFISVVPGEQVEVALSEEGLVLEYYLDMLHQRKLKGNIYKGVIHNIDSNLQAAFVSYGTGNKNGFLQIDEVHPEYYLAPHEPAKGKKFPPIQKVLKTGQEVLVQVVKEPTGNKGAFLTTWVSLAGRFLVLTPGQEQIGVSRKLESEEERSRLREMMSGIDPGQGLGVIVRTVSAGTTKTTLKNDLQYLKRVWRDIRKKATEETAPALIYQEPGLPQRAVRDYLTEDVCEIWVDNADLAESIRETVSLLYPRRKDLVKLHSDSRQPLWERFNLRRQLDQIYAREVFLPSGGRLVFDQTEALMAVDINSGKTSGKSNFETMAHRTNMEAAEAIARQLKLRDVGGQVVIDFIEMRDRKHVQEVEKTLRHAMKNDRARHDVGRMSSFGLLELVRQRTGTSALSISTEPCPHCGGTGQRRNMEWRSLQALRELRALLRAQSHHQGRAVYEAAPDLALYLLNHKRDTLRDMEQEYGKSIEIVITH